MISCQETRGPILKMKGLWNPYAFGENEGTIMPNDMHLGEDNRILPPSLLLTGPNVGRKSTLMRSTCLAVILAQLECFVLSECCVPPPVGDIFTCLGATYRIMTGESEHARIMVNSPGSSML